MVNTLIPLWDMANHDDGLGEISTDYDDEAKALKCMAAKDYKVRIENSLSLEKGLEFPVRFPW